MSTTSVDLSSVRALSTRADRMLPGATCLSHKAELQVFVLFLSTTTKLCRLSPALLLLAASMEGALKRVEYQTGPCLRRMVHWLLLLAIVCD
jgi:hypothetical protein